MAGLSQRTVDKASEHLHGGEFPVATGITQIGQISVGERVGMAVAGIVAGAITGVGFYQAQEGYFALLTNERLIFLKSNGFWGPTKKLAGQITLAPLSVVNVKWGYTTKVTIAVQGQAQGFLLKTRRAFATSVIDALGGAPAQAVAQ